MEVVVMRKENYGTVRFYPDNREATILVSLMGKKTFDHSALQLVKELGMTVQVKYPEVKL